MSITATTITDWIGNIDGGVELADEVAQKGTAPDGQVYRRQYYRLTRYCYAFEVSVFATEAGSAVAGNTLVIKNGADSLPGPASATFFCESDDLNVMEPGSQMWKREQLWTAFSDWTLYTPPYVT